MVNNMFWRLEPALGVDVAAVVDEPELTSPPDLVAKLKRNDGIVLASWDARRDQGRVHALGIVKNVEPTGSIATVQWRRTNFTVNPSSQGRTQWISRTYFKFDRRPAANYGLRDHFEDTFSGEFTAQHNRQEPVPPVPAQPTERSAATNSAAQPAPPSRGAR
jgi:hypothetical protein